MSTGDFGPREREAGRGGQAPRRSPGHRGGGPFLVGFAWSPFGAAAYSSHQACAAHTLGGSPAASQGHRDLNRPFVC